RLSSSILPVYIFFCNAHLDLHDLHSFPTRRSSDLYKHQLVMLHKHRMKRLMTPLSEMEQSSTDPVCHNMMQISAYEMALSPVSVIWKMMWQKRKWMQAASL